MTKNMKQLYRILAMGICISMVMVLGAFNSNSAYAATKKGKLPIKSTVASRVIDIKGSTRLYAKGINSNLLKFSSNNKKIAKVNSKGVVTGLRKGTVRITVFVKKNKKMKTKVTIKVKNLYPSKLTVNATNLKLKSGEKKTLKASVKPEGVYCPVNFSSNSNNVKIDSKGVITAKKKGNAVITVKSKEKTRKGKYLMKKIPVQVIDNNSYTTGKLADGTWYGTGTYSFYYSEKGPDIVKVSVKNGKIASAESIKEVEDDGYRHGKRILDKAEGLSSTESLEKQLKERKGDAYDAVAGATLTAKGHLSSVSNALERSRKYRADKIEQKIDYFDFETRPNAAVTGKTLDLSKTKLKINFKNGDSKVVPFGEISKYGIFTSPKHGSALPAIGTTFMVNFKNDESLIKMPIRMQVQKELKWAHATHILVKYKDGKQDRIDLNKDDFVYNFDSKGTIDKMEIYRNDTLLAEGEKKVSNSVSWEFDLSKVEVPEGFDFWTFKTYRVNVKEEEDSSPIKSFELNVDNVKKDYNIGDRLNLSNLSIKAVTEKGNEKIFNGWSKCEEAGFSAAPENSYEFKQSDVGKKTITVTHNNIQKSFDVNVLSKVDMAPSKLKLYDGETFVQEIEISPEEFVSQDGRINKFNIETEKKASEWAGWNLKVKAYDKHNRELNVDVQKKNNGIFKVIFKDYKNSDGQEGYAFLKLKLKAD